MARISLSYAREDEAQVRGVYRRLLDAGFEVWMDQINLLPGQRWQHVELVDDRQESQLAARWWQRHTREEIASECGTGGTVCGE
jgi:hypothetical protein